MTTTTRVPVCDVPAPEEPIRARLRRRLLSLDYYAFAQCLCLLLEGLGYEEARPAGRTAWKGRNKGGGYDIVASVAAGLGRRRVVVQAKQFDALPVFRRAVDELRGACLRAGAHEALLITTSAFSPVARQNDPDGSQTAPVRLVDGEALLSLMLRHRVGVMEKPDGTGRLEVDHAFFGDLSRRYPGHGKLSTAPDDTRTSPRDDVLRTRRWTVSIRLTPPRLHTGPRCGHGRGE